MFTHYRIDPDAVCTNGRESADVMAQGAIIPNYDRPNVRPEVRADLAQIRQAGFSMIRTVLWFTQDRIIAPWGQLRAPLGEDDARRIKDFGDDIRLAGFKKWLIVTNPGIRNSPLCKIKNWGDCYDPTREATNFSFIRSVHDLLAPLQTAGFHLEYDLSGELCPSRWLPPTADAQIEAYLTHLIQWYSKDVSRSDFHISCGGLSDDRTALLLQVFDKAGVRPNAIDVHFYDTDPSVIERKLVPAAMMARQRGLPLDIGEMQYENLDQASAIHSLASRYNICFSELIEWPLRGHSMCQINVAPPFSSRILQSIAAP
jgi:hypothetical protein